MTTRQLGRAQQDRYIKELEAQGCTVRYGARGSKLVVRAPDGATTSIHFTTSDIRSLQASISWFRRHGLRHPDDTKEERVEKNESVAEPESSSPYPVTITEAKLSRKMREAALATLRDLGWPLEIKAAALPMDASTAAKALYAIGYRWPEGFVSKRGTASIWHAPEEIRKLAAEAAASQPVQLPEERVTQPFNKPIPSPAVVARNIAVAQEVVDREKAGDEPSPPRVKPPTIPDMAKAIAKAIAPEPEPEVAEREFIDTAESWTVDINGWDSNVPQAVLEYLSILRSAGLEVEIRVWRKDN